MPGFIFRRERNCAIERRKSLDIGSDRNRLRREGNVRWNKVLILTLTEKGMHSGVTEGILRRNGDVGLIVMCNEEGVKVCDRLVDGPSY